MALAEFIKIKVLRHENIVTCYSAFVVSQPKLQLCVLEYCAGGDLDHYIGEMKKGKVPNSLQVHFL